MQPRTLLQGVLWRWGPLLRNGVALRAAVLAIARVARPQACTPRSSVLLGWLYDGCPSCVFGARPMCRLAWHSGPFGLARKRRDDSFAIFAPRPHLHGMPLERGLLQLFEQWRQGLYISNKNDQPANITAVPVFGRQL